MTVRLELRLHIFQLVSDLVHGRYGDISRDGRVGRLTEAQLRDAVGEYGRTLVELPEEAWQFSEEYPQVHSPNEVAIDVDLWTAEEGRSDLTLSLSAVKSGGTWTVSIDSLHVL